MRYVKVYYMCPKCNQIFFFNKNDYFSTICKNCNEEMVCIGEKYTSTEAEERQERIRNSSIVSSPTVTCSYCGSINTSKIFEVLPWINNCNVSSKHAIDKTKSKV